MTRLERQAVFFRLYLNIQNVPESVILNLLYSFLIDNANIRLYVVPVIPALTKQRQEDQEIKANLS